MKFRTSAVSFDVRVVMVGLAGVRISRANQPKFLTFQFVVGNNDGSTPEIAEY